MTQALKIHHDLADVVVMPDGEVNKSRLKSVIRSALDRYLEDDLVPAEVIHAAMRERHGEYYLSAGYHLRVYRHRADLTQAGLARQIGISPRQLSEMENNRRAIDEESAKNLAKILRCDYRKLQ